MNERKTPLVKHYFDVWHVAKGECMCPHAYFTCSHLLVDAGQVIMLNGFLGFCKKVKTLAKKKDCELVDKWEQSIINRMYWCVVSTPNGKGDMMVTIWLSLENLINNKHSGHGRLFQKCSHGSLVGETETRSGLRGISDIH